MERIGEIERNHSDGPAVSSYHPLQPPLHATIDEEPSQTHDPAKSPTTLSFPWLPCHYFDYMAGTSTGG